MDLGGPLGSMAEDVEDVGHIETPPVSRSDDAEDAIFGAFGAVREADRSSFAYSTKDNKETAYCSLTDRRSSLGSPDKEGHVRKGSNSRLR